jgi:hypothetical protein
MTFTSAGWNLQNIITEARGITGRPDQTQISDAQMTIFANYYYQFVMPKELKIFFQYKYYSFFTLANVQTYNWPVTFATLNPAVYADGFPMEWYTDPDLFYQDYPVQDNKQTVATGNGAPGTFSFNISSFPVLIGTVYVTDGVQVANDNGKGGFVDSVPTDTYPNGTPLAGTINYVAGTVTGLVFLNPTVNGANIVCTFGTYQSARPQAILYFNNTFTLALPPDQVYEITMEGLPIPTALSSLTDVPFRPDLGPLIALGMSLHIFKLYNQMDQYQQYLPEYNRFKDVCMQDTYEVYLYQRSVPAF